MNTKTIFWIVIVVFVVGSVISFSSLYLNQDTAGVGKGEDTRVREQIHTRNDALSEEVLPENSSSKISYTGLVKEMGYSFYMQGTHYLVDDNGKTITLLQSDTLDLSQYLDEVITAYGTIERTVEGDGIIMTVDRVLIR